MARSDESQVGPTRFICRQPIVTLSKKVRILRKWCPTLSKGRIPTVEGDLIDPGTQLPFRDRWSSSRLLVCTGYFIRTKSGSRYELHGEPYFKKNVLYPEYILKGFKNGFPPNWKNLFQKWILDVRSEGSREDVSDNEQGSSRDITEHEVTPSPPSSELIQLPPSLPQVAPAEVYLSDPKYQPFVALKRLSTGETGSHFKPRRRRNPFTNRDHEDDESTTLLDNVKKNSTSNSNSSSLLGDYIAKPTTVKQTRKNAKIMEQLNKNHSDNLFDLLPPPVYGRNTVTIQELFDSDSDQDISIHTPRTPIIVNSTSDPDTEEPSVAKQKKKEKKKPKKFKEDAYVFKKSQDLRKGRKRLLSTVNREPLPLRALDASIDRRKKLERRAASLTRPISHLLTCSPNNDEDDESLDEEEERTF